MPTFVARVSACLLGLALCGFSLPAQAKTLYKDKFNKIEIVKADKGLLGENPFDHPQELSEAQINNMLASLRFDKSALIFRDIDDRRLLDKRGLELLVPHLARAFAELGPEEVVLFRYIKKAPYAKVFRNDRLIIAECFLRGNELYLRFSKLYAKIFDDYDQSGRVSRFLQAQDLNVDLNIHDGQRKIGEKFIALSTEYDFKADLDRQEAEEKIQKKKEKAAKETYGIPLPEVEKIKEKAKEEKATAESEERPSKEATGTETTPESDTLDRLRELKLLLDQGAITKHEYKEKRRAILKKL